MVNYDNNIICVGIKQTKREEDPRACLSETQTGTKLGKSYNTYKSTTF